MKASELVEKIQEAIEEHGDLEVFRKEDVEGDNDLVEEVNIERGITSDGLVVFEIS